MLQNGSQDGSKNSIEAALVFCCFSRPKNPIINLTCKEREARTKSKISSQSVQEQPGAAQDSPEDINLGSKMCIGSPYGHLIWFILRSKCQLANHMGASLRQRPFLTSLETTLGALWDHFGSILGSFWHPKEFQKAIKIPYLV